MSVHIARHYFSVSEYDRMGQTGVLPEDVRVELIEGEIIEMSPVGSRHAACVKLVSRILNRQVGDRMIVSTQDPIVLDDFSEPQPDIALLKVPRRLLPQCTPEAGGRAAGHRSL